MRFQVVVRYVDIRLEVTGKLEVGKRARLTDILRLHVQNRSTDPVAVFGAEITLQILRGTSRCSHP